LLGCLLVFGLTGCEFITGASPAARDIRVTVEPTLDSEAPNRGVTTPGIIFENVVLEAGRLERSFRLRPDYPGMAPTGFNDPCYYLNGNIRNEYDQRYWVAFRALGFDDLGNGVSFTLDNGPIMGVAALAIEGHSSENFTLHLTWSDNVSYFRVTSARSTVMPP
jgi:hypothetical protein